MTFDVGCSQELVDSLVVFPVYVATGACLHFSCLEDLEPEERSISR